MIIATIQPGREETVSTEVGDPAPATFSTTRVIVKMHTPGSRIGHKNQFVFCGNNAINFKDPLGLDVIFLVDDSVVLYQGHAAVLAGSDQLGWTYYSFGSGTRFGASDNLDVKNYPTLREALWDNPRYDRFIVYRCSERANIAARREGNSHFGDRYNLFTHNCDDVAAAILRAAGVNFDDAWRPVQSDRQNRGDDESNVPRASVRKAPRQPKSSSVPRWPPAITGGNGKK